MMTAGSDNIYPAYTNFPLVSNAYMGRNANNIPWVIESTSDARRILK
jgi:hypothetical protein